jgi:thymidine phosphorylase
LSGGAPDSAPEPARPGRPAPSALQALSAPEIIRAKRDGLALVPAQIQAFARGLADGRWSEGQAAALAMAVLLRGMDRAETVALTAAMTASGQVLDWRPLGFDGPVLDKHSTGGVGDKVSLVLAPLLAACGAAAGAIVPMVSGRGLAHTGGTLDKLESLPGFRCALDTPELAQVLRGAGCAIVGAGAALAPADRRLYAIRDVTATVESVPLITASILSKKLAAGVGALAMDVKCGPGAFAATPGAARELARSLVDVAGGAGLPTVALVTDMGRVLGRSAGHALEVAEAVALLRGDAAARPGPPADPELLRLRELTLALAAEALVLGGVQASLDAARQAAAQALDGGAAAERFARMVALQGGPADVLATAADAVTLRGAGGAAGDGRAPAPPWWPAAPVVVPVPAPRDGFVAAAAVRELGLAVVALGGGRQRPGDAIDPRVGLAAVRAPGEAVRAGEPLAWVHAADAGSAAAAVQAVRQALPLADAPPTPQPLVLERVTAAEPGEGAGDRAGRGDGG